jgi:hypothetical protein
MSKPIFIATFGGKCTNITNFDLPDVNLVSFINFGVTDNPEGMPIATVPIH